MVLIGVVIRQTQEIATARMEMTAIVRSAHERGVHDQKDMNARLVQEVMSKDLPELPISWYRKFVSSELHVNCGTHTNNVGMVGHAGQASNTMIEIVNLFWYALSRAEVTEVQLPRAYQGLMGHSYDLRAATHSWICVTESTESTTETLPAKDVYFQTYFSQCQSKAPAVFQAMVLQQFLLRPNVQIKQQVDMFIQSLRSPGGYIAIHLRWLDGHCLDMVKRIKDSMASPPSFPTANDVCTMSDVLLVSLLRRLPALPLVVTHDGQQLHRVEELKQRFNAIVPPGRDKFVDIQVMLRAQYFIPNPTSSLSYSVHLVRNFTMSSDFGIQRSEPLGMMHLPFDQGFTQMGFNCLDGKRTCRNNSVVQRARC